MSMERETGSNVFLGPDSTQVTADVVRNVLIKDVLAPLKKKFPTPRGEIGFSHGRLHSFRHFFVSQAFLGGVSEGEIREWVGHRNSRIVERYRHLRSEDAVRKMNRISFFVGHEVGALAGNDDGDGSTNNNEDRGDVEPGVPKRQRCLARNEVLVAKQAKGESGENPRTTPKVV